MNGNHDLTLQCFCHAKNVDRGHLVLIAYRIFAIRTKGHINLVFFTVLCIADRIVAVSTVIDIARWRLNQIIDRFLIHIIRQSAPNIFVCGNDTCAVKGLQYLNLAVTYFDTIARSDHDASFLWYAIAQPFFHTLLGADKRHLLFQIFEHCSGKKGIDVVIVIVSGKNSIHIRYAERIVDDWSGSQIWLSHPSSGHVTHLVERLHLLFLLRPFSVSKPQINRNISIALSLDPQSGTTKPPHCHISRGHLLLFDLFIEPGAPLGECA